MTHEFAVKITWNELHAATRDDFLGIRIEKEKQDERTEENLQRLRKEREAHVSS